MLPALSVPSRYPFLDAELVAGSAIHLAEVGLSTSLLLIREV